MLRVLTAAAILCTPLGYALAGEVSKPSYSRYYEWESTECYKPSEPYIYELNESNQYEAESYIEEVQAYISCVQNEAERDYAEARKKIASGIEENRDEVISEVQYELENFISGLE